MRIRPFRWSALSAVLPLLLLLAACSPPALLDATRVRLHAEQGMLSLHRDGRTAQVRNDGGLSIDGHDIALSPTQQTLLRDYYASIEAVAGGAAAIAGQGIEVATSALDDAARGASGHTREATTPHQAAKAELERQGDALEADGAHLKALEARIAAEIPELAGLVRTVD